MTGPAPYRNEQANRLYNLLFCDDPALLDTAGAASKGSPWSILLATTPDVAALERIASDATQESRVRAFAYNKLRGAGRDVPAKQVLGVIVEVPLDQGLDTLAAYADGGVRYLNQSGKIAIFEGGPPDVASQARELVASSQGIVDAIGPWDAARRPPPPAGSIRITFLVSDGLYFGEGPFEVLQRDAMAGPLVNRATRLLQSVVDAGLK